MALLSVIRRWHLLDQMPIRKIARRTGLSRNTIRIYIDLFKRINDQYVHAEGDETLKAFNNILRENFRDTDVIGRIGGDEFAVRLGNCTLLNYQINLDRLDSAIETYNATANIKSNSVQE